MLIQPTQKAVRLISVVRQTSPRYECIRNCVESIHGTPQGGPRKPKDQSTDHWSEDHLCKCGSRTHRRQSRQDPWRVAGHTCIRRCIFRFARYELHLFHKAHRTLLPGPPREEDPCCLRVARRFCLMAGVPAASTHEADLFSIE